MLSKHLGDRRTPYIEMNSLFNKCTQFWVRVDSILFPRFIEWNRFIVPLSIEMNRSRIILISEYYPLNIFTCVYIQTSVKMNPNIWNSHSSGVGFIWFVLVKTCTDIRTLYSSNFEQHKRLLTNVQNVDAVYGV